MYYVCFLSIVGLLVLDQFSKYLFFDLGYFSSFFLLTPSFNTGIAWSLPVHLVVVVVLSFVFLLLFFYLYLIRELPFFSFVFLVSGTIGNLIDRLLYQGVRDFFDLGFFPIFNFADIYLTIGVVLVFWIVFSHNSDGQLYKKP